MVVSATYATSEIGYGFCGHCGHELDAIHYCVNGYTLCKNCSEVYGEQYKNTVYTKKGE